METTPQKTLKTLPHAPGVYLYRDAKGNILYVGKAKNLKRRVTQYFQKKDALGPKTQLLVSQIAHIETIRTASEFDALLLEAKLIHDHKPKYNVVLKDDKSPLYILLTLSERIPRVLLLRRSDLPKNLHERDALFGPFQSAHVGRSLLRQLRHVVPYCTQKRRTETPCFYSHLGLCNPCPSDAGTDARHYRRNIFRLKHILSGKSNTVLKDLQKEMNASARTNNFEEAARLRNHRENLYALLSKKYDPLVYTSAHAVEDIYTNELSALGKALGLQNLHRIECVDISNTGGAFATGSLVVLTDGARDTSQYRRFRIRRKNAPNDVAMIAEVVNRRFAHPEWPMPDLLIIDGGKGQLRAAAHAPVPTIGLAKRFEEIIVPLPDNRWKILRLDLTSPAMHIVQRIRDEAHHFALSYHRLLRKKSFVKKP